MKPSSSLISISLLIFIMAETAHRKQRPWWTNNTPASCFFCPLSLIWREREWPRADSNMIYCPRRRRACFCLLCQIHLFFSSLSHLNLSPLQNIAQSSKTYSRIFLSKAVLSASLLIELMPGLKSQSCMFTLH